MAKYEPKQKEVERRTFLKHSSAIGGGALSGIKLVSSELKASDLKQNPKRVIDAKITYPEHDQIPFIYADNGRPDTLIDDGRLFLISPSPSQIAPGKCLLRSPFNLTRFTDSTRIQQNKPYIETTYDGRSPKILNPSGELLPPRTDIHIENSSVMINDRDSEIGSVSSGQEKTITLSEQTVEVKKHGEPVEKPINRPGVDGTTEVRPVIGSEKISVTPSLKIHNRGKVSVYGSEKGAVLPNEQNSQFKSLIRSNQSNGTTKVELTNGEEMARILHDYQYRGGFDEGGCQ